MNKNIYSTCAFVLLYSASTLAEISIVGSSSLFPYAVKVAENYSLKQKVRTPRIESNGSGGGMRLFCSRKTNSRPLVANMSRKITREESDRCATYGRDKLQELTIGFDGIVVANNYQGIINTMSIEELKLIMAKYVINEDKSAFIKNPHVSWSDINSAWPVTRIELYGPPHSSGTRDVLADIVLEQSCSKLDITKTMSRNERKLYCTSIRTDGHYIDSGENDNLIVSKLRKNKNSIGVIGYSLYYKQMKNIHSIAIDGVMPNHITISKLQYPLSRSLYMYVSKQDIKKKKLLGYLLEFFSKQSLGKRGYLSKSGLVPIDNKKRLSVVKSLKITARK